MTASTSSRCSTSFIPLSSPMTKMPVSSPSAQTPSLAITRRLKRERIKDMVISDTVLLDKPFIITGRRNCFILQIDEQENLPLTSWVLNRHREPLPSGQPAERFDISREGHHAGRSSRLLHYRHRLIRCITFADSSYVDLHARLIEIDRSLRYVGMNRTEIHEGF